jgi:leucyl aminopeptidase
MSTHFNLNTNGIPLDVITRDQLPVWMNKLSGFQKNWLQINKIDSQNFALIPSENGNLERVLAILPQHDTFFIAEDLPAQLPTNHYVLDPSLTTTDRVNFAISWALATYRFDRYISNSEASSTLALQTQAEIDTADHFYRSIELTRDLVNTPASDMMPQDLATTMSKMAEEFNGTFSQYIGEELLEHNYPTIHAVGRASDNAPRLLDLRWGDSKAPKVTLVGKGVCFDSGGLNLKPGNSMRLMKKDMGGAAHVIGLARLIMAENLPINLRVLVPAVENAVSSNAFRPGDVIKTRQGITVEIDNTDAEGRLVLCDALTEADSESPDIVIDFATLTGACRVALGTELPGYFCNDDKVADELFAEAKNCQDLIWRLPLHNAYEDMLKSQVADMVNSSSTGLGGAITAALYLQRFVSPSTPWIHFDVMAWNDRKLPGRPVGGDAFGLRAVFHYLKTRYV